MTDSHKAEIAVQIIIAAGIIAFVAVGAGVMYLAITAQF